MQMNLTTDYAIRMMRVLYEEGGLLSVHGLSQKIGVTEGYIRKLTRTLKEAGYIKIKRGKSGGVVPAKKPSNISLYDITKAVEPSMRLTRCLDRDGGCSANCQATCPERIYLEKIQLKIEKHLAEVTFDKLIDKSKAKR